MNLYEEIINILEMKGSATIPAIWEEMNQLNSKEINNMEGIDLPSLRLMIGHKRDWFRIKGDIVSIRPEREPVKLIFHLSGYPGPEVKISIDFKRQTFILLEWRFGKHGAQRKPNFLPGSILEFKRELYSLNLWEWEKDYHAEGIIVDGTSWSVVLETKTTSYHSEGFESFPKQWKNLCRALMQLTGGALRF
ncbi:hypothetical protein M3182_20440 [Mesobacillus maritimus]|uniref:hypothetical protein n=1 Tax=Mesobacillus maritimus TaxID=1643336 RepID=UPI00203DD4FC|nr:hypothetical protein [Mesobacillus maritimus]MCM3588076.1 hypothetical protein [Mesobacillus maritimus]